MLRYFYAFKKIQDDLEKIYSGKRNHLPCTFEEMMLDFGLNAERRELIKKIEAAQDG